MACVTAVIVPAKTSAVRSVTLFTVMLPDGVSGLPLNVGVEIVPLGVNGVPLKVGVEIVPTGV